MITHAKGNISMAPTTAIVNTVNCKGVSGAGVAKEMKIMYPDNYAAYAAHCDFPGMNAGEIFTYKTNSIRKPYYILNMATKNHWMFPSTMEWVDAGLCRLLEIIIMLKLDSVTMPRLGCGNGGLNWERVQDLITKRLGRLSQTAIIIMNNE